MANERAKSAFSDLMKQADLPGGDNRWYREHGGDASQLRRWKRGDVIISKENWDKLAKWLAAERPQNPTFVQHLSVVAKVLDQEREQSIAALRRPRSVQNHPVGNDFVDQSPPRGILQQVRRNARDIVFWHTFRDRDRDGKGVRDLIENAENRVVVTGGSLDQCVWRFRNEILEALKRKVLVGLVMATPVEPALKFYIRYADSLLRVSPLTRGRYEEFYLSLSTAERGRFALFYTDIPLTHSLGLYDDQIFVSEFCIDRHAEQCPSYAAFWGSHAYGVFFYEIHILLKSSRLSLGSGKNRLLANVGADAKRTPHYRP